MKHFAAFLLSIVILFTSCAKKEAKGKLLLIPVQKDNKWGYIDTNSNWIIPPRFIVAHPFEENLALVREGGLYGYIDQTGNYVISAQYEYAEPFTCGVAHVWANDSSWYINPKNEVAFRIIKKDFSIDKFENNRAIVYSNTGKQFLFDTRGRICSDTNYIQLTAIGNGKYIARKTDETNIVKSGVIDTSGKVLIPFSGQILQKVSGDGFFIAGLFNTDDKQCINVFNEKNELIITYCNPGYSSPYITANRNFIKISNVLIQRRQSDYYYDLLFDKSGNLLINLPEKVRTIENFPFGNLGFARPENSEGYLIPIDTKGNRIGKKRFLKIIDDTTFNNNLLAVNEKNEYVVLNEKLEETPLPFLKANYDVHFSFGFYTVYEKEFPGSVSDWSLNYNANYWLTQKPYGWMSSDFRYFHKPEFSEVRLLDKNPNVITTTDSLFISYFLISGKKIYQFPINNTPAKLNIDHLYDFKICINDFKKIPEISFPENDYRSFVYWVRSQMPKVLPQKNTLKDTSVLVITNEFEQDSVSRQLFRKIRISNPFNDSIYFRTGDNTPSITIEALDKSGKWKSISFCNQTFYSISADEALHPDYHWELAIPEFEGSFKTQLRVKIEMVSKSNPAKTNNFNPITFYSQPYEGSVNPAQFWREANVFIPFRRSRTVSVQAFYLDSSG